MSFSGDADADLEEIARSGAETWGAAHAKRYAGKISKALDRILNFPGSGQVFEPRPSLRSVKAGEHRIYYQDSGSELLIVRVLHPKMDAIRHLA